MTNEHLEYVQKCIKKYGSNTIRKFYWYATINHPRTGVHLSKTEIAMLSHLSTKVVSKLLEDELADYESFNP